jgi:hypothetical protein
MEDKDQVGVGQLAAMTLHEFTRRPPIASFSGGLNRVKMLTIKTVVPHLVFTRVEHLSGDLRHGMAEALRRWVCYDQERTHGHA